MSSYHARYKSGECESVIRELTELGKTVAEAPLISDAAGVASELVERAFANLKQISLRLTDLGYIFQNPEEALVEASATDLVPLNTVQSSMGSLPIVVRKWYERIKSVDFSQQESQLFGSHQAMRLPVSGLGLNTPLVFISITRCLALHEQVRDNSALAGDASNVFSRFLPLGAWGSNSNPKGFYLPCESFDAEYYNEGAGSVCFVDELRRAFKWGGFPFWRRLLTGKKQAQPLRHAPDFENLLPILTKDLLQI